MEILDIIRTLFIPVALAMAGYQLHVDRSQNRKIERLSEDKITEERVRSIIADKAEALHLADNASKERLDRVEDRINQIDAKLDKIMDILRESVRRG